MAIGNSQIDRDIEIRIGIQDIHRADGAAAHHSVNNLNFMGGIFDPEDFFKPDISKSPASGRRSIQVQSSAELLIPKIGKVDFHIPVGIECIGISRIVIVSWLINHPSCIGFTLACQQFCGSVCIVSYNINPSIVCGSKIIPKQIIIVVSSIKSTDRGKRFHIIYAVGCMRSASGLIESRQQHCGKNGNDRNHDEELDKSKNFVHLFFLSI